MTLYSDSCAFCPFLPLVRIFLLITIPYVSWDSVRNENLVPHWDSSWAPSRHSLQLVLRMSRNVLACPPNSRDILVWVIVRSFNCARLTQIPCMGRDSCKCAVKHICAVLGTCTGSWGVPIHRGSIQLLQWHKSGQTCCRSLMGGGWGGDGRGQQGKVAGGQSCAGSRKQDGIQRYAGL